MPSSRCCFSVNPTLKSGLKSLPDEDAQGNVQPIRRWYACSFASGARDAAQSITSWLARCTAMPLKPSAIDEQEGQPAAKSGPNMKWYTRSCERPRKRSASEALPSSVSKRYPLLISTQGSSCLCRASWSLRSVSSFSALSSSSRAFSHCSWVPVLCVSIVCCLLSFHSRCDLLSDCHALYLA